MSDTRLVSQSWGFHNFNPRSPQGGATATKHQKQASGDDFNPRSRKGERQDKAAKHYHHMDFNPRSPRGGATHQMDICSRHHQFQSTLPTRGSDCFTSREQREEFMNFNPRSPRGGATLYTKCFSASPQYFNPRSPRGGATSMYIRICYRKKPFQSTLPTRGSDAGRAHCPLPMPYFNPRSPRGGATMMSCVSASLGRFQSTLPTRGSDP